MNSSHNLSHLYTTQYVGRDLNAMDTQLLGSLLDSTNVNGHVLGQILQLMQAQARREAQRQRENDAPKRGIAHWKQQNEEIAVLCYEAAENLDSIWKETLEQIAQEGKEVENEWDLKELCDKWGHMVQQLQTLLHVLSLWGKPK